MPPTPSPDELHHPEWLGAWIGDMRVAFPTAVIHAVFSTHKKPHADTAIAPLDVEVHAGVPVFLMPLAEWLPHQFESTQPLPVARVTGEQEGPWVVAFQPLGTESQPHAPCVGCRVEGIRGPFRGDSVDGHIHFEGVPWPTWTPRQPA